MSNESPAENGAVWLKLTGREAVKAFLREEISGLLGTTIDWIHINSPTS